MTGDCHVRILESAGVRLPCATYPYRYFLGSKDICVFLAYLQFGQCLDILITTCRFRLLAVFNIDNMGLILL